MIVEKIDALKQSRIKQKPVLANRASQIGHPCKRYLVFERTRWQEKVLHDVAVQYKFDDGQLHENGVMRDLEDAGFQVYERQRDYHWPKFQISAHLDGKLLIEEWMLEQAPAEIKPLLVVGRTMPCEVKSCTNHVWNKTDTVQDMRRSKYAYMQAYPGQLTIYDLLADEPVGFFLLKNKETGRLKEIWVILDLEYAESLLQKAEEINRHVAEGTVPEPLPWSETICGKCSYNTICLPEAKREALDLNDDPELLEQLTRRQALKAARDEYEEIDKDVKEKVKGKAKILCGDFLITGRYQDRKDNKQVWMTNIESLKKETP